MLMLALFGDGSEKGDMAAEGNKYKKPAPAVIEDTEYMEDYVPFTIGGEMDEASSVMGLCREGEQQMDQIRGQLNQLYAA